MRQFLRWLFGSDDEQTATSHTTPKTATPVEASCPTDTEDVSPVADTDGANTDAANTDRVDTEAVDLDNENQEDIEQAVLDAEAVDSEDRPAEKAEPIPYGTMPDIETVVCPYCEEDVPQAALPMCPSCSRHMARLRVQNQDSFLLYMMDQGYLARHWVSAGRTVVSNEDVAMRRYFVDIAGKRLGALHVERHEVRLDWDPTVASPDLTPAHWQFLIDAFQSYPDPYQGPDKYGLARLDMLH